MGGQNLSLNSSQVMQTGSSQTVSTLGVPSNSAQGNLHNASQGQETGSMNMHPVVSATTWPPTPVVSLPAQPSRSFGSTSTMSPERYLRPCVRHTWDHLQGQYHFVLQYPAICNWNDLTMLLDLIQRSYLLPCNILDALNADLKASIADGVWFLLVLISCVISGADFGATPTPGCLLDQNAPYYHYAKKLIDADCFNEIKKNYGDRGNSVDALFHTFNSIGDHFEQFYKHCTEKTLWFFHVPSKQVAISGGPVRAPDSGPLLYVPLPYEMHNFLIMYFDALNATV
jgi:hypothetical protein